MRKIAVLLMLLVIPLFSGSSCAPTVSQEEYDGVNNELSTIQSQLVALQGKLAEAEILKTKNEELSRQFDTVKSEYDRLQTKYEGLGKEYEELGRENEELNRQYNTVQSEYDDLQSGYKELTTEYEELSEKYDAIIGQKAEIINEEDVEQAIFELVNQERKDNGLDELMWGKNLYQWAINNSRNMANNQIRSYSEYSGYQQVFWATGYDKTDSVANAALMVWKNEQTYDKIFLNTAMKYCAVAVYKAGEIFYITLIIDHFR